MTSQLNPTPRSPRSTRSWTVLGVAGGLLAGTAAGLIVGVPGLSSAASDGAPAAVVQQVDDTTDTSDAPDTSDDRSAVPGQRMREALQVLVDDGTITAAQADAVVDQLLASKPERGEHGPRGGHGPRGEIAEVVTELLGVDAEALHEQLRAGSSLADIAAEQGVEVQALIDALVADAQEHLDDAVADGRLTEDEAAERAATLEERITARVNGERPDPSEFPGRGRRGGPDEEG